MAVDLIRYPLSIDRCAGSVKYSTTIIELGSGKEQRIVNWDDGKLLFNAMHGVRSLTDWRTLQSFFRRRKGEGRPFLVRDLIDYQFDQAGGVVQFATGNATAGPFQLKKAYTDAYNTENRDITKPEQGTIKIYVNGVLKTETTHYTIDYATGKVTFTLGNYPATGAVLEVSGRFFVAVRFAVTDLPTDEVICLMKDDGTGELIVDRASGQIPQIPMIEVFE